MKKIYKDKILQIKDTTDFDNTFLMDYLDIDYKKSKGVEVFFIGDLLKEKENKILLDSMGDKYAIYSNVYSEKDELQIFEELFLYATKNQKKIHIVGITLQKELDILEEYYKELGFLRDDINCFRVDFSVPLVTVSVNIENLMYRGSDYKRMGKSIFFLPPIREAGLTKSVFKGINRGVIAGININKFDDEKKIFLKDTIINEHILPLNMQKILRYNLEDIGFCGEILNFELKYDLANIEVGK